MASLVFKLGGGATASALHDLAEDDSARSFDCVPRKLIYALTIGVPLVQIARRQVVE
jgi:hypothetical protein